MDVGTREIYGHLLQISFTRLYAALSSNDHKWFVCGSKPQTVAICGGDLRLVATVAGHSRSCASVPFRTMESHSLAALRRQRITYVSTV